VIPPERIAEEDQIIAKLRAGERIEHFETERLRSDGQRIIVSLTISPIKDEPET
jgi:PAS domain S-box-containing protein